MKEMVISITPEGRVEHTLKDSFFDTRFLGHRKIERMTEIVFCEESQRFYIRWLKGPYTGYHHSYQVEALMWGETDPKLGKVYLFDTYEAAVQREIELVNQLRLQGISFD